MKLDEAIETLKNNGYMVEGSVKPDPWEVDVTLDDSVFDFLYNVCFKNWADYNDGIDNLKEAFRAGWHGSPSWEEAFGCGRNTFEDPDYLDSAFNAGAKIAKLKTKEERRKYLLDYLDY